MFSRAARCSTCDGPIRTHGLHGPDSSVSASSTIAGEFFVQNAAKRAYLFDEWTPQKRTNQFLASPVRGRESLVRQPRYRRARGTATSVSAARSRSSGQPAEQRVRPVQRPQPGRILLTAQTSAPVRVLPQLLRKKTQETELFILSLYFYAKLPNSNSLSICTNAKQQNKLKNLSLQFNDEC